MPPQWMDQEEVELTGSAGNLDAHQRLQLTGHPYTQYTVGLEIMPSFQGKPKPKQILRGIKIAIHETHSVGNATFVNLTVSLSRWDLFC